MDLLASLGLGGALPEQSTRLTHPSVIKALDEGGSDVRLGFNRCLACGIKLLNSDSDTTTTKSKVVSCQGCKRVSYCSASCQKMDCEPSKDGEEEEAVIGHSPVVCALLNLCNDDEDAEEEMYNNYNKEKKSSKKSNEKKKKSNSDQQKTEAAHYRVRTELESYPATLFNILPEGPDWFIESITQKLRKNEDIRSPTAPPKKKQRRGKRDRSSISPKKQDEDRSSERKRELVLHIVGASVDSELWNFHGSSSDKSGDNSDNIEEELLNAYGEAATNLTSYLNNLLEMTNISIRCIFVGPDCPKQKSVISHRIQVTIPDSTSSTLSIETHACYYGSSEQPYLPAPDAVIFFNPGFSCPDYNWSSALNAVCAYQVSSRNSTPILITTNTELEGFADIKYLLDGGYFNAESLSKDVLEAVDYQATSNETISGDTFFFFGENPYAGLRVRQSGTMGNDLYVKSKWIIGGLLTSSSSSSTGGSARSLKKRKIETKSSEYDSEEEESRKKKARRSSGNTKKKNPALI